MVERELSRRQAEPRHPFVEVFQLLLFGLAGDAAGRRGGCGDGSRALQVSGLAVQQFLEPPVGLGREQELAGFQKVPVALHGPEHGVHRYPL